MPRWLYTDAKDKVVCPKCGVDKGTCCSTPKGYKLHTPHAERISALHKLDDFNIDDYTMGSNR